MATGSVGFHSVGLSIARGMGRSQCLPMRCNSLWVWYLRGGVRHEEARSALLWTTLALQAQGLCR